MLTGIVHLMSGYPRPWWIAGGWAIDLFVGEVRRDHSDIDIAVLREDQRVLQQHLKDWNLTKVVSGAIEPWLHNEHLAPPTHEIHARRGNKHAEFLLNETRGGRWLFRRNATVTMPLDGLTASSSTELPTLCPEIVLLYKAKSPTQTDREDFCAAAPRLSVDAKRWLRDALETCHPGHEWCSVLVE